MEKTVEAVLDLGDLKQVVEKAAKESGVSVNEFICDVLKSKIKQNQDDEQPIPTEHERHLLGISEGWQEASDYAFKKATEKFLKGDTPGAVALRDIGNQMRDTSQRIFKNIEDEANQ